MEKYFKLIGKVQFPLYVFLAWRTYLLFYQLFIQQHIFITDSSNTVYERIYLSWATYWDSGHYVSIALKGYQYPQHAFFPLWPLLINITSFGNSIAVGFVLSILFNLTVFILFYLLCKKITSEINARTSLILFALFPSTIFLLASYTENLFLVTTMLSFLMLEHKRYYLSALFGGLCSATRLNGSGIVIAFLTTKTKLWRKINLMIISFSGILGYMLFLKIKFNNPFLFLEAQREWCSVNNRCQLTLPTKALFDAAPVVHEFITTFSFNYVVLDWICAIAGLLLLKKTYKTLSLNYFMYSVAMISIPLMSGSLVGMARYILVVFPAFMVLGGTTQSKRLRFILYIIFAILQLKLVNDFTANMWVA